MAETMAQAIARRRREREALEAEDHARRTGQRFGEDVADTIWKGFLQADTAMRTAANVLTFGGADTLAAGLHALAPAGGNGLQERFRDRLAAEHARDQYDTAHRATAQQVGALGATALSLFGGRGLAAPRRLEGAAAQSARETAAILGAGGLSGLGFQSLSDATAGRPSDWRDSAGAAAGGVAGAAAVPFGPGRAAAIGSAATAVAQDALHGRLVSLEDLGRSATAGRAIGGLMGTIGQDWAQGLSPQNKGRLGETLGTVRSAINGLEREPGPKTQFKPEGSKVRIFPDGRSGEVLFEDKFGPSARLSKGQRFVQSVLGPDFILYHFLPEDVGRILGFPSAGAAPQLTNRLSSDRR